MKAKYRSLEPLLPFHQIPRPCCWADVFGNDHPVDVEIGFGFGEYLIRSALGEPQRNFLGLEKEWERINRTLRRIAPLNLTNVRVMRLDAEVALGRYIAPQSVAQIYCLFPCPWPKRAHEKYRLFSKAFLRLANSRLQDKGTLKIVTDDQAYFSWIQGNLDQAGFGVTTAVVAPRYDTKYERKWHGRGQREFYEMQLIKAVHRDVPLKEDRPMQSYRLDHFDPQHFQWTDESGEISIIYKEFIYDAQREKALVRLTVAEEDITQHIWVSIFRQKGTWHIRLSEGCPFIPTVGVQRAIELVYQASAANRKLGV